MKYTQQILWGMIGNHAIMSDFYSSVFSKMATVDTNPSTWTLDHLCENNDMFSMEKNEGTRSEKKRREGKLPSMWTLNVHRTESLRLPITDFHISPHHFIGVPLHKNISNNIWQTWHSVWCHFSRLVNAGSITKKCYGVVSSLVQKNEEIGHRHDKNIYFWVSSNCVAIHSQPPLTDKCCSPLHHYISFLAYGLAGLYNKFKSKICTM